MSRWRAAAKEGLRRARLEVHRTPVLAAPTAREGRLGRFDTALGPLWLPLDAPGDIIVRDIRAGLVFESEVVRALLPHLRRGSAVFDVGANFGQMAVAFAHAVGAEGEVHAIEANATVADVCERNARSCRRDNIVVHRAAAWDASGETLSFPEPDFVRFGSYASYPVDPSGRHGTVVKTVTVDEIVVRRPVSIIKVDVHGADLRALAGARATIARDRPAVVFEFEQQFQSEFSTTFQDYVELVASIGYRFDSVILGINYLILPREGPA